MRDYCSDTNVVKAAGLSAVVTLMSVGRIIESGVPLLLFLFMAFCLMTFVSGAVTAWGRRAGMAGIITDRRTLLRGLAVAAILAILTAPASLLWLEPALRDAVRASGNERAIRLACPPTAAACLSAVLWGAGFQTMFFQLAPMSLFARLTGRQWMAICLCVALRGYVMHNGLARLGIAESVPLFYVSALGGTAAGCFIFARFGMIPAMLFSVLMGIHVFFS